MTQDELTQHRLQTLEKIAEGARQTERQVDLLSAAVARFEAALAAQEAATLTRDTHMRESLGRLHQRLDAIVQVERVEEGARSERARLGRWLLAAVGASTALASVIVAAIAQLIK